MSTFDVTKSIGLETIEHRESRLLAPYAVHSADSRGRQYHEPNHPYRGPFQRDRDRIIHTAAYRRLSAKTQVFTGEMGDYHRTRLTHTHEVASIARTIARALRLNEDLVEALALLHDIGHPPFGHSGEDVLDECLEGEGRFSHNDQALRIVELLEIRYHDFTGLNLSHETLDGQRFRTEKTSEKFRPSLEAQAVDAADSIAYDSHDADDALELGLLCLDDLHSVRLWREAVGHVRSEMAALDESSLRRAVVHQLIDWQVSDLLHDSSERLAEFAFSNANEARLSDPVIRQSSGLVEMKTELEQFLFRHVYRHPGVVADRDLAQAALREIFAVYHRREGLLPKSYRSRIGSAGLRRTICDYLTGMTDRFAWREHRRLCDPDEV
ncbi:MAG: dNTP triphosphohydrolase [Pirellulales bacterium]